MRTLIFTIFIIIGCNCGANLLRDGSLIETYSNDTYSFILPLFNAIAYRSNVNFVCSPRSVWLMLAAIAEGSNEETKQQLFKILNLSDEPYYRYKYYELMTSRISPSSVINLVETRTLLMDESLDINPAWLNLVTISSLLDAVTVPMHSNPQYTENWIKRLTSTNDARVDLRGNAVLLDTIDYDAIWATAFDDAIVEMSPFYSQEGEELGSVELMRIKRRAKYGYVKSLNLKILELPVGRGQYNIMFVMALDKKDFKSIVKSINNDIVHEIFNSLNDTEVPIDIAIPRIKITSELDMREILKEFNLDKLWTETEATKYISTPPAFPRSYVQRATLTFDKFGLAPIPQEDTPSVEIDRSSNSTVTDFIVNQPFICGLLHAETRTPLISMGMSQPTIYKYGTTYIRNL